MSLIIPNAGDTSGGNKYETLDQAEPDALDFEILSVRGSGVVSGCAVATNGTNNSVSVAAGTVMLNGVSYQVSANSSFGMPTAPADNRFDIVVARVSGGTATITAVKGDDSATNPSYPKSASVLIGAPSSTINVDFSTDVVLAAVYRSGSSTITGSRIVDKRVTVTTSIPDQGASVPATGYGSGTGSLYYKTGTPSGTASGVYLKTDTGPWIELAQNVGAHLPIGAACLWPSTSAVPSGCVEANGQLLSTSAYPALFAVYSYTHGGSGGTFGVPNYNNLFVRGTTNTSAVGTSVGADSVTLSEANLPTHSHGMTHTHTLSHTHEYTHGHTSVSDTAGSHTHALDHNHASFNTASGGTHAHNYNAFGLAFVLNPEGTYLQFTSGFTANDKNWVQESVTPTAGGHVHAIDVPAFTGTSDAAGSHSHLSTTLDAGTLTTGAASATTTSAPSSTTTTAVGSGTAISTLPGSTYARWIIRASLGTDTAFTGGITGPWSASQTVTTVSAAGTYTVLNSDIGNLIVTTNGSAVTLSLTTGLDMVAGQRIDIIQSGAGQITVSATGGPTVNGTPGLRTRARYSKASLICIGTDNYILEGDVAA